MRNSLVIIFAILLIVFSVSVQPLLPEWLHPLQLWLVFPLMLLIVSVRHALITALVTGWILGIYFFTAFPGQHMLLIPASCLISFFLTNSWRTHRIWLLMLLWALIGSVTYQLLTYGVFFSYSLFTQSDSTAFFAPSAWSYLLLGIGENMLLALLTYRLLQRFWPDAAQQRNPFTRTHVFTT